MSLHERVRVGVGTVVLRDGRVLLGKRIGGKHGDGEYSFPGGKPDGGESPQDAALRELWEETGLAAHTTRTLPVWTYDVFPEHDLHYVTLYFHVIPLSGDEPLNLEPEKCEGWDWFDLDNLPSPLFAGVREAIDTVSFAAKLKK